MRHRAKNYSKDVAAGLQYIDAQAALLTTNVTHQRAHEIREALDWIYSQQQRTLNRQVLATKEKKQTPEGA